MNDFGGLVSMEDAFMEQSLVALQGWGQRAGPVEPAQASETVTREPPLRDLIRIMGHLMLRHDQDTQATAQQVTFILCLVLSQEGTI